MGFALLFWERSTFMLRAIRVTMVAGVLAVAVAMAGCIAVGGDTRQAAPTVGQELTDLKMALDRGAITQGEFEAKKSELLARRG
jgi:hypothetical protein